jgi:hypothetical protein
MNTGLPAIEKCQQAASGESIYSLEPLSSRHVRILLFVSAVVGLLVYSRISDCIVVTFCSVIDTKVSGISVLGFDALRLN